MSHQRVCVFLEKFRLKKEKKHGDGLRYKLQLWIRRVLQHSKTTQTANVCACGMHGVPMPIGGRQSDRSECAGERTRRHRDGRLWKVLGKRVVAMRYTLHADNIKKLK